MYQQKLILPSTLKCKVISIKNILVLELYIYIYLVEINIQYIGKYINIFEQQLRKVSLRMDVYFLVHEKVTYIIAWFTN